MISIEQIEEAGKRLRGVAELTPLNLHRQLSSELGASIYIKREDLQSVRSFKIRGAFNKISSLKASDLINGVVCASAGNHAQGVAFSCEKLDVKGVIFMPVTTPQQKIDRVRYFGKDQVKIVLHGDAFDDAQKEAMRYAAENKVQFIHPFDDEMVMAGQGTIGREILAQIDKKIDYVIVAVGGGGLISGIGSYMRQLSPDTKIIAVESSGAAKLSAAFAANKPVELDEIDSFADGIAVRKIGEKTFACCRAFIDKVIRVDEGEICSTILKLYNEEGIVVEPAGAIGIAALNQLQKEIKDKNVVVILCGANNDIHRMPEIRERSFLWEGRKHYFIIRFAQRAGALKEFLNVLGDNDDIAHFEYTKKTNKEKGPALVGIELGSPKDFDSLIQRMKSAGIKYQHINDDSMLFDLLV